MNKKLAKGDVLLCIKNCQFILFEGFFYIVTDIDLLNRKIIIKRSDKIDMPLHLAIDRKAYKTYFKRISNENS